MTTQFFYIILLSEKMKSAMKRDSSHYKDYREKPFGARLYWKNDEPVLELYTDHFVWKAILGAPITAQEY